MRAYIVLLRNDLSENMLELSDLRPSGLLDMSARNPQMGYLSQFVKNETPTLLGSGPYLMAQDTNGLAAYLMDNVENAGTNVSLTTAQAVGISQAILASVGAGGTLTLSDVDGMINAEAGVSSSDLDGSASNSTGSVADILSILSGDQYIVPAGSEMAGAANAFPSTGPKGALVRKTHTIVATSELRMSMLNGKLNAMYALNWTNPKFTYGSGGTAKTISGADIAEGVAIQSMAVYGEDGLTYWG